jgi:hypothetical protein
MNTDEYGTFCVGLWLDEPLRYKNVRRDAGASLPQIFILRR